MQISSGFFVRISTILLCEKRRKQFNSISKCDSDWFCHLQEKKAQRKTRRICLSNLLLCCHSNSILQFSSSFHRVLAVFYQHCRNLSSRSQFSCTFVAICSFNGTLLSTDNSFYSLVFTIYFSSFYSILCLHLSLISTFVRCT